MLTKGYIKRDVEQSNRRLSDKQLGWYDELDRDNRVQRKFNITFFSTADSREPEQAGILGALVGSLLTLLVRLWKQVRMII